MSSDLGQGVQVVDVKYDHTYELDEGALANVLLRDDIKDLPVVVLSVAGAFRGGKSFLLDFFLRYLNATEADRDNETWLGKNDEPLVGFNWRYGAARDTIGIHIWSRPFISTLPSGEQVAVILMDTQGTFDGESTLRGCVTIFAMSTLLSSVQVYNLSGNLKEDDLQHLQLFTEYAKLVGNDYGKPFQHLLFLIRDWMFTGEYPSGSKGGKLFLETKLQVNSSQPAELQDMRQYIRSCFQNIECFLMDHPGFQVCQPDFKGRLADLRPEFKTCLLELVPLLLDSSNLVPKRVGSQLVTARDFMVYFRTYIDMFNSGDLPTPANILEATAEASLVTTREGSLSLYIKSMEDQFSSGVMPAAALYRAHGAAVTASRQLFSTKKLMGDRRRIEETLTKLMEELDSWLPLFVAKNEMKTREAVEAALNVYVERVVGDGPETQVCRSFGQMEAAHQAASAAAEEALRSAFRTSQHHFIELDVLLKDINERYKKLLEYNEENNVKALRASVEGYLDEVGNRCPGAPCMSERALELIHVRAKQQAEHSFLSARDPCSADNHINDSYFEKLIKEVKEHFTNYKQINKLNNENAVFSAVSSYKESMANAWGTACSQSTLNREHEEARTKALDFYHGRRTLGAEDDYQDNHYSDIEEAIAEHYRMIAKSNAQLSLEAVESACREYSRSMDIKTEGLPLTLLPVVVAMIPIRLLSLYMKLESYHVEASAHAISHFKSKRRDEIEPNGDQYYKLIQKRLGALYEKYKYPLVLIARDFGLNI